MFEVSVEFLLKIIGLYPSRYSLIVQITLVSIGIFSTIMHKYIFYSNNQSALKMNIFFVVDIFQNEMFILLQIYIYYCVYKKRSDGFFEKLFKYFKWRILEKSQKRLKLYISIIVGTRFIRFILYFPSASFVVLAVASAEIVLSMSDLLFVVLLENLIERQKILQHRVLKRIKVENIDTKIFEMIRMERKILKRFSYELYVTILYNYFQMIVCLYWFFMRISHRRLRSGSGQN